ncbi:MAG: single-stranded DNA-binding protein [Spirochaetia bacterium]|jgi:single-strand selective monofunctional uracil DNA glycosylase|nr:single-stranded DNA-binding protein [Spirochaetia bacterium]
MNTITEQLLKATEILARDTDKLKFSGKVNHVYNPLVYAKEAHEDYIKKYGTGKKKVLFLGMNPGPWGMAQTGIPFGEVSYAKNWLKIEGVILQPEKSHSKRPIEGWNCPRSEVSGRRLWSLMEERYKTAASFFKDHYIENYCPLVFMEVGGKNLTPDKLPVEERDPLKKICDDHLRKVIGIMEPEYLVGVGKYAEKNFKRVVETMNNSEKYKISAILHPSPANPHANRGWSEAVTKQLIEQGIWP